MLEILKMFISFITQLMLVIILNLNASNEMVYDAGIKRALPKATPIPISYSILDVYLHYKLLYFLPNILQYNVNLKRKARLYLSFLSSSLDT
jgi:hypothetical protein